VFTDNAHNPVHRISSAEARSANLPTPCVAQTANVAVQDILSVQPGGVLQTLPTISNLSACDIARDFGVHDD
jgi:hypothetical protein